MAGEHILKLLLEENVRIENNDRGLIVKDRSSDDKIYYEYCVYERKPYHRKTLRLIETEDEKLACKILKGG